MFLLNRPEVSLTVPRGSVFGSSCNFCYLILSTFHFLAFHHALGLLLNLKIKLVLIFFKIFLNKLAMNTNFLAFFCFYLKNFPSWIRIRILNADLDPGAKMNADRIFTSYRPEKAKEPKKRYFHELLYTEIVKSATNRLASVVIVLRFLYLKSI